MNGVMVSEKSRGIAVSDGDRSLEWRSSLATFRVSNQPCLNLCGCGQIDRMYDGSNGPIDLQSFASNRLARRASGCVKLIAAGQLAIRGKVDLGAGT